MNTTIGRIRPLYHGAWIDSAVSHAGIAATTTTVTETTVVLIAYSARASIAITGC